MAEAAKIVWREDQQVRVEFYARTDGLVTFAELTLERDEPYPLAEPYFYWSFTYQSGLHASLEEAKAEARAVIPWLRELADI